MVSKKALRRQARQDEMNAKYFHSGWDAAMKAATEEGGIAYDRDGYRAMWQESRAITRAVHEALEAVEAPPAESLAGRVLALHEVLENQRRADTAPMPAGHYVGDGCVEPEGVPLAAEPVHKQPGRINSLSGHTAFSPGLISGSDR